MSSTSTVALIEGSARDERFGDTGARWVRRQSAGPAFAPDRRRRGDESLAITLNHTIIPAHDKDAAARFFAGMFGLRYGGPSDHFAPVRVNDTLTLDFDTRSQFEAHHYAFQVSDAEFDAILHRVRMAGLAYGSDPWHLTNHELNAWNGGRGFYFLDPNGHILELMTRA